MEYATEVAKTLRNHWKKSAFAAVVVSYGLSYTKEYYDTQKLMRSYCERAALYGKQPMPVDMDPKTITVILNPNANKRKAAKLFEKYCAPILHLAGIYVDVIQTESEGHAKVLMETISGSDAIVVAGGDGTLSEVVTGLMRRTNGNETALPIGVLPLGRSNTIGKNLFPGGNRLENVRSLADASMAIIQENTKPVDVMKIEVLDEEEDKKPIYALTGIRWGAYRDAKAKQEKYWYFGPFRKYATYLFNGYKKNLSWKCEASVVYTLPCTGCSNCRLLDKPREKWYSRFLKPKNRDVTVNYANITNHHCKDIYETQICTSDLTLMTCNVSDDEEEEEGAPKLRLMVGPDEVDYIEFVAQGWKSEQGLNREVKESIEARQVEIIPLKGDSEKWFSIDNEDFEVKPVRITLLPKVINMFCKKEDALVEVV